MVKKITASVQKSFGFLKAKAVIMKKHVVKMLENPEKALNSAIVTVDGTINDHVASLERTNVNVELAAAKAKEEVQHKHINAAKHQLKLKLLHEDQAERTRDDIYGLAQSKTILTYAVRGRKIIHANKVIQNAKIHFPEQ